MSIPDADRAVLRDLAKKVAEIADLPVHDEKAELWRRHNRLERVKPMVLFNMAGSAWEEALPSDSLECSDDFCRNYELQLRRVLYQWEHLRDDRVISGTVGYGTAIHDTGVGVQADVVRPDRRFGAAHYEPVIRTEADLEKLEIPAVTVDWEATERNRERVAELFDGILTPERSAPGLAMSIMDSFVMLRGIEQTFTDIMDRPEWLHQAMDRMVSGCLHRLEALEKQNALKLNNGGNGVGSGGIGFTDELPRSDFDGQHVRPADLWGFATTQIFCGVSPATHEEFALQYERRYLERFGLNCYGCCEPLAKKMAVVKTIPNLRRVSMSPWVDVAEGAAAIGDEYIFSWKPHPAPIVAETWEPDAVRAQLRDGLEKTRGCVVELIMNGADTCRDEPHRMWEWTEVAMDLADEFA